MTTFQIMAGAYVLHEGQQFEIARVLDLETVLARRSGTGELQRISIAQLLPVPLAEEAEEAEPPEVVVGAVPDADWQEAERRLAVIRPMLDGTIRTRRDVEAHAQTHGVHFTTLYAWRRLFERSGRTSALLPYRPTGGRGKSRLKSEEAEAVMRDVIERLYLSPDRLTPQHVIDEVHRLCNNAGLSPPHGSTIRRRINTIALWKKAVRRLGKRAAKQKLGGLGKGGRGSDAPLAIVEIDHTLLDVMVVDELSRLAIGRPWLTLVIDVYTRVVLGFYLSLDPPSAMSVGLALVHAILPKERWLSKLGLEVRWPFYGLMAQVRIDNAKEFHSVTLEQACEEHHIGIEWRRLAHPEDGPYAERALGTFAHSIHALRGTTFSNYKEKGDYDSAARATMTLAELERWLALLFATNYHEKLHRGIGTAPAKAWEAAIFGIDGRPGIGLPARIIDEDGLRLDFTPLVTRTIQRYGVQIDHMQYDAGVLDPFRGAVDPVHPKRKRSFVFRRDPRDITVIYFFDPDRKRYHRVPARDLSRPSIALWEWKRAERYVRAMGRKDIDEDVIWDGMNQMRKLEKQADEETQRVRRDEERRRVNARVERPVLPEDEPAAPAPEGDLTDEEFTEAPPSIAAIEPFPRELIPGREGRSR